MYLLINNGIMIIRVGDSMKDKKSTLNKKVKIEETQSESMIRLFGLFFIVFI